MRTVNMDFLYGGAFGPSRRRPTSGCSSTAMLGDPTLFTRGDEVEEAWSLRRDRGRLEARPALVPELRGRARGVRAADELMRARRPRLATA